VRSVQVGFFFFFLLVGLEFELKALHLQSRHSTASATPPVQYLSWVRKAPSRQDWKSELQGKITKVMETVSMALTGLGQVQPGSLGS
jgi:hypothetical protein